MISTRVRTRYENPDLQSTRENHTLHYRRLNPMSFRGPEAPSLPVFGRTKRPQCISCSIFIFADEQHINTCIAPELKKQL